MDKNKIKNDMEFSWISICVAMGDQFLEYILLNKYI